MARVNNNKRCHPERFYKKTAQKDFVRLTGEHLLWSRRKRCYRKKLWVINSVIITKKVLKLQILKIL